jgi:hypothetical protein
MDVEEVAERAVQMARRANRYKGKETQWFLGYMVARDEEVDHERAMVLADKYVEKIQEEPK